MCCDQTATVVVLLASCPYEAAAQHRKAEEEEKVSANIRHLAEYVN